jgi:hypothetical protein
LTIAYLCGEIVAFDAGQRPRPINPPKHNKKPLMKKILLAAVMSVALSTGVFGASNADDNASTANYPGGTWADGSNGGVGFGAWTLSTQTPDGGFAGSYIGGTGVGDPAFGIFAGDSTTALSIADRPFTGGALASGQTFSVKLGNTTDNFGEIGFQFLSGQSVRWTLKHTSGQTAWQINDGENDFGSGQNFVVNTPLTLSFTYNGGNSYSYTFGNGVGENFTANNDLSDLTGVRFYNRDQGGGQNFGFNDLQVVPEPSTYALLALSGIAFGGYVIRRRRR